MNKDEIAELLNYLNTARTLETEVERLKNIETRTISAVEALESKKYPALTLPYPDPERSIKAQPSKTARYGAAAGALFGFVLEYILEWHKVGAGHWLSDFFWFVMATFILGVIFSLVGAAIAAIAQYAVNQRSIRSMEAANDSRRQEWNSQKKKAEAVNVAAITEFRKDIGLLKEVKDVYLKMLEDHYQDGPIYRKYRTFPAVCQLYEYFESGRFVDLPSAYNQYELEVRLDRIIDTTERAVAMLRQISLNQQLLYEALVEVSSSVNTISLSLERCIEQLDSITFAQELTNISLRQTAMATTLLSQIELYKNRHNLPFVLKGYEGYLLATNAKLVARRNKF